MINCSIIYTRSPSHIVIFFHFINYYRLLFLGTMFNPFDHLNDLKLILEWSDLKLLFLPYLYLVIISELFDFVLVLIFWISYLSVVQQFQLVFRAKPKLNPWWNFRNLTKLVSPLMQNPKLAKFPKLGETCPNFRYFRNLVKIT